MKRRDAFFTIIAGIVLFTFVICFFLLKFNFNTHVEAVNMDLTNYKYDYYVQRNLVKIAGDVGTATYTFKGMPAIYDLKIAYVDEDDGNSTYTVDVKGKEIAAWVADKNPTKDNVFLYLINDVRLDYGTPIRITGTRDEGEGARIVYLDIVYANGMTPKSVFNYLFSYIMCDMPVASIFVLLSVVLLFLVTSALFFMFLQKRNKISGELSRKPINNPNHGSKDACIPNPGPNTVIIDTKYQTVNNCLINKLRIYLDNNFSDTNFSVQEMADKFGLSMNYLSSYYKDKTNESIVNYITNLRIEKAKHLLVTTDLPIKKIARSTGYYNVSSFIRRFKQLMGVTPGKYRENNL